MGMKLAFFEWQPQRKMRPKLEEAEGGWYEPALLATDSARLRKLGVEEGWGGYPLCRREAGGKEGKDKAAAKGKGQALGQMEGELLCVGSDREQGEVAKRYHDAHAQLFNPFLISLEREDSGEGLWWGGRAGEDVPEVGAHICNDALGVGQNADLCVGGELLPVAGLTLDPVDKHTVWSGMEQREVLVSYGEAYWMEFRKRKEEARLRKLSGQLTVIGATQAAEEKA